MRYIQILNKIIIQLALARTFLITVSIPFLPQVSQEWSSFLFAAADYYVGSPTLSWSVVLRLDLSMETFLQLCHLIALLWSVGTVRSDCRHLSEHVPKGLKKSPFTKADCEWTRYLFSLLLRDQLSWTRSWKIRRSNKQDPMILERYYCNCINQTKSLSYLLAIMLIWPIPSACIALSTLRT